MANQTWLTFRYKWGICCLSNPTIITNMESCSLDLRRLEKQFITNKPLTFGAVRISEVPQQHLLNAAGEDPGLCEVSLCLPTVPLQSRSFPWSAIPGEEALEPEDVRAGKGLCADGTISQDCAGNALSTHCPPIVLLWNQGQPGWGKKGNQNVNTGWSFLQGNSAMACTEKKESFPFFLYVRISL